MRKWIGSLAIGAATLAATVAYADMAQAALSGEFWSGATTCASNATLACVGGLGAPTGMFTTSGMLNFNSNGATDYTVGSWLGTGGVSYSGPDAGGTLDNTAWEFSGKAFVTKGETFTITHDDGVSLYIDGMALSGFTSGPTGSATETGTWTGKSGVYSLQLVYGECCGAPGVLSTSIAGVPEASTWAMMVAGFAGLGFAGYRASRRAPMFG